MKAKKVLVIGGGGRIGSALRAILGQPLSKVQYDITIADSQAPAGVHRIHEDMFRPGDGLRGYDYCVNLAPMYDPKRIAPLLIACVKHKVNYFDVSEDIHIGDFVRTIAESQSDTLFAPHCGLAPGFINIFGRHITSYVNAPVHLDLRVGALPRFVANQYKYLCTWSVEGLVNEYLNDARILSNGVVKTVNVFANDLDRRFLTCLVVDGVEYESFPTSGGCSTMMNSAATIAPSLRSIIYRSIRYPGHFAEVLNLVQTCGSDRHTIISELGRYKPALGAPLPKDRVIVFASAHDTNDQQSYSDCLISEAGMVGGTALSAIQRTTAGALAVAIDLHATEKVSSRGYLTQESIAFSDFSTNPYYSTLGFSDDKVS